MWLGPCCSSCRRTATPTPGRRWTRTAAPRCHEPRTVRPRGAGPVTHDRLLTTVVGSYPQPDWLVDREALKDRPPPRVRARELWRVDERWLDQAQDDATLLAIRDMERAGIDIVTDGEIRRESYSNPLATGLEGIDPDRPGVALGRTGRPTPVPRVVGPVRRRRPVLVRDLEFLRRNTDRRIKITLPGPFTMTQQAQNDHYPDDESLAMDYAAAVNEELRDLKAAGADVVQLDEPYLQARAETARRYAVAAINRALEGIPGPTALHTCFGYAHVVKTRASGYSFLAELNDCRVEQLSLEAAQPGLDPAVLREVPAKTVILGVLDLDDPTVETPEIVARRIDGALKVVPPERLIVAPDCGMKYLSRAVAFGKLRALVEGSRLARGAAAGGRTS
ncbi:MAG: cobalamin-independent methionine synthase II family protein [Candidatus Rokubacteria bacterium]|nr:cobalamin-independent methionine synthase II family protein [Candidatus Rokubacteria bacterium]